MRCVECGEDFYSEKRDRGTSTLGRICPECLIIFDKRAEIRDAINVLKKYSILEKHSQEFRGISGFSHAEKEQFSLTLLQIAMKLDLPDKAMYFVNDERKETFQKLRKETIDSSNQASLEIIRKKLVEKGHDSWTGASYNEIICCCINQTFKTLGGK